MSHVTRMGTVKKLNELEQENAKLKNELLVAKNEADFYKSKYEKLDVIYSMLSDELKNLKKQYSMLKKEVDDGK